MKKIDVRPYKVKVKIEDGADDDTFVEKPVRIKDNLAEIIFHPDLRLGGRDILQNAELADKIEACKDDFLILEDTEYNKIVKGADVTKGLGRHFAEFFDRIYNAETVEVQEKNKEVKV